MYAVVYVCVYKSSEVSSFHFANCIRNHETRFFTFEIKSNFIFRSQFFLGK